MGMDGVRALADERDGERENEDEGDRE